MKLAIVPGSRLEELKIDYAQNIKGIIKYTCLLSAAKALLNCLEVKPAELLRASPANISKDEAQALACFVACSSTSVALGN